MPATTSKILSYPLGLGSSDTTRSGLPAQYMLIKINTPEKGTRLRDDKSGGDVYVVSDRVGTGISTAGGAARGLDSANSSNMAGSRMTSPEKSADPDMIQRYGIDAVKNQGWSVQKGMTRVDKAIVLPMPEDLQMHSSTEWSVTDQTVLTQLGDALNQRGLGLASDAATLAKNVGLNVALNAPGDYARGYAHSVPKNGAVSHIVKSTLSKTPNITNFKALNAEDRLLFNPKKEVLFDGFGFRKFRFSFLMAPKSAEESKAVNAIIETLRYYHLPEISAGKLFYIYPSEFEIRFIHGSNDNPNIPKIASCALTDIDINYSPGSTWATLPDGSPVARVLNLEFTELELIDRTRVYNAKSTISSGY